MEEDVEDDEHAIEVIREFPGTWAGRTLILSQDSTPRACWLLAPGAMIDQPVGERFRWRLATTDGEELEFNEVTLRDVVAMLPSEWKGWALRTHREQLNRHPDSIEDVDRSRLADELDELERSDELPLSTDEVEDSRAPGSGRKKVTVELTSPDHEFMLAAADGPPPLGRAGQSKWATTLEDYGIELEITVYPDMVSIERRDHTEASSLWVQGEKVAPGEDRSFRLAPAEAEQPLRRGERLGDAMSAAIEVDRVSNSSR